MIGRLTEVFVASLAITFASVMPSNAQDILQSIGDTTLSERSIQLFILLTILSLVPALAIMFTCFPFMVTVLAILRQGLGLQQSPPNMLIVEVVAGFRTSC